MALLFKDLLLLAARAAGEIVKEVVDSSQVCQKFATGFPTKDAVGRCLLPPCLCLRKAISTLLKNIFMRLHCAVDDQTR